MKLLVFEYITGGGFNQQDLPETLIKEGRLMLEAMLNDLAQMNGIELLVMLDWRVADIVNTTGITPITLNQSHDPFHEFVRWAQECDAVWPVAPEFNKILQTLCQSVEKLNKILLTSPYSAVAVTGDKFKAFEQFSLHQIDTVDTRLFKDYEYETGEWIVKPVDGVGCMDSYLIADRQDFSALNKRLSGQGEYIVQPHLQGAKTSLSCLFKQGRAWLLCVNLQRFIIIDKQYRLIEIEVNYTDDIHKYHCLSQAVAKAFPDLWGYGGIDLIESDAGIKALEINPRVTTSFAGIKSAIGINVCRAVIDLLTGDPQLDYQSNQSITIKVG